MRVLVTGGSGFIGSHLVDALVDDGHDVLVVDRAPAAWPNADASYVVADLSEPDRWAHLLDGVDAVSHQAARVGLGVRFDDVIGYARDNDLATARPARALDRGRLRRPVRAGEHHGDLRRGAVPLRCTAVRSGPGPARRSDLNAGRFEPPARPAAVTSVPPPSTRTIPSTRATSTPPPSSTKSTSAPRSAASAAHP